VLFLLPVKLFPYCLIAVFSVAAWEWANFSQINKNIYRIAYALAFALCVSAAVYFTRIGTPQTLLLPIRDILGIGCTWWAIALLWVMNYPATVIYFRHPIIKMIMGLLVLVPSVLALIYLSSLEHGIVLFLYVIGIVVMADVGAYVFGKWLGNSKLAPHVSPGKSWAGFWGGLIVCLVYALSVGFFYTVAELSLVSLVVVTGVAALASVLGDLLESMMKRERGIKDSSQLLPGHGGFMDRIDSITAAAPVFTLLMMLLQVK
jgi:phosphatidate cytidylyltransferase